MSKQIKQQYGVQGLGALATILGVGSNTVSFGQAMANQGLSFLNLKYSRDHENEADHMGLIFAAMAGYDPSAAVTFWQRMSAASTNNTAEFLSDHPSDATRIKNIQGWLPEAMKYYKPATTTTKKTTTKKSTTKKTTTKKTSTKKSK
jgi:predicted Zn-dependent protease